MATVTTHSEVTGVTVSLSTDEASVVARLLDSRDSVFATKTRSAHGDWIYDLIYDLRNPPA